MAVDPCLREKSFESLVAFLAELERECPFVIIQIQTDNGVEFTDKYRVNSDGKPTGMAPTRHVVFTAWNRAPFNPHRRQRTQWKSRKHARLRRPRVLLASQGF